MKKKVEILSDERCRTWSDNETRLAARTRGFGRFERFFLMLGSFSLGRFF